jgi:ABC-type antimicrobial peptide transport system permease subunit
MTKGQQVGLITFGVFMAEAMLHYNYGVKRNKPEEQKAKFVLPPTTDLIKITATVALFSVLNGVIINKLSK